MDCLNNKCFYKLVNLKRAFIISFLTLSAGCASVTQRHDFLSSSTNLKKVCGTNDNRQNALFVQSSNSNFIIQAKSIGGLQMTGLFFAPIIPWESLNLKDNIIRVYSNSEFSSNEKEELKNWEIQSQDSSHTPTNINFSEEAGTIGNYHYSHLAELSFKRSLWATDFILLAKMSERVEKFNFISDTKWSYQWMGNEPQDPKCVSR